MGWRDPLGGRGTLQGGVEPLALLDRRNPLEGFVREESLVGKEPRGRRGSEYCGDHTVSY